MQCPHSVQKKSSTKESDGLEYLLVLIRFDFCNNFIMYLEKKSFWEALNW